jgi:integrase
MARLALVPFAPEPRRGGARKGEPRRDNHTGSVTRRVRRGKVQWVARWPVPPAVRACGWVERVAATEREAKLKLKELRAEHERGRFTPGAEQPLADYLGWWLETNIVPHCSPETAVDYEVNVRRHIVPRLGRLTLAALARADVQAWVNDLRATGCRRVVRGEEIVGCGPRAVQYAHATLRAALNDAIDYGFLAVNPAARVRLPPPARHEARALTVAQADAVLAAVRGHRHAALYALVIALGLREAEVCGLRWADVDLERGRLPIRQTAYRAGGRLHVKATKCRRARPLVLPPTIVAALRRHRARQAEERRLMDDRWRERGLVFPSRVGTDLLPRQLLRHFQETLERINRERRRAWAEAGRGEPPDLLPRFTFHELRHTAASLLHAQGVGLKAASEILGHAEVGPTADTYSHLYDEARADAAGRMEEQPRRLDIIPPEERADGDTDGSADGSVDGGEAD